VKSAWHTIAFAIGCAAAPAAPLLAADCTEAAADCVQVGQWQIGVSVGLGVRTNPLLGEQNIPLVVIPSISYYGKRIFLDNLDLGVTLLQTGRHSVALLATPGYDRAFFVHSDLQNFFIPVGAASGGSAGPATGPNVGVFMPYAVQAPVGFELRSRKRQVTYLAGAEWQFGGDRIETQLSALHEVTGRHRGNEVRGAVAYALLRNTHRLTAATGLTWKSAELVNYYYGDSLLYLAGAAFNPFAKLSYTRPLGEHWSLQGLVHVERLDDAIANSPFVDERTVATVFFGAHYRF
jgi:MipA family protein